MCDSSFDDLAEKFQLLSMEEVRLHSREDVAELAKSFQWDKVKMEKIVDELFADKTSLSRIAHLLLFAELLIERFPLEKINIYETTFQSLTRNLRF